MYIIIGQGAAGTTAATALRQMDTLTPVTIITNEHDCFYSRIDLPDVIAGKYEAENAVLQKLETFADQGINCRMGERVAAVLPLEKVVKLVSGELLPYASLPDIYAAGDAAEAIDNLTGSLTIPATWPVVVEQGRIAASNMAGYPEPYGGSIAMNSVEIAGMPLVSVGDIEGQLGYDNFVIQRNDTYRKIVMRGVLCLGDIRQAGVIGGLVLRQEEVDGAERLISPFFSFADLIVG